MSDAPKTHRSWDNVLASLCLIAFGGLWFNSYWGVPVRPEQLVEIRRVVTKAPELNRGNKGSRSIDFTVRSDGDYFIGNSTLNCTNVSGFIHEVSVGDELVLGLADVYSHNVLSVKRGTKSYIDLNACNTAFHSDKKFGLILGPTIVLVTLLFWFLKKRILT